MPALSYRQPGLVLSIDSPVSPQQVRDLQHDLRALGYLRRGIDGAFGSGTQRAVAALQNDLLRNAGAGSDGSAPVRVVDYNRGRVTAVTGKADQGLVECISDMLDDARFPKLPWSQDPVDDNRRVAAAVASLPSTTVPTPYLVAILRQESGLMHFAVPRGADQDSFVVVGTDTNSGDPSVITSRGYGAGQYTLFHHPPRPEEVSGVILDPGKNVQGAARLLRDKFDRFVNGPASRADDRIAEIGSGPLRSCKYAPTDPRYLTDCKGCATTAGFRSIRPGLPVFPGSTTPWAPTQYYGTATYDGVPVRERIGCDWPYAVRRYNGGGINSYHYQARVLKFLAGT
ncbi:MAG TPA: peptidoglycan-binding domain-containing protein [Longimicrobiaceae bacterium]|nr:peptidoglycan-binding domain-containing protein [Longimicrobiaceae bacterium]